MVPVSRRVCTKSRRWTTAVRGPALAAVVVPERCVCFARQIAAPAASTATAITPSAQRGNHRFGLGRCAATGGRVAGASSGEAGGNSCAGAPGTSTITCLKIGLANSDTAMHHPYTGRPAPCLLYRLNHYPDYNIGRHYPVKVCLSAMSFVTCPLSLVPRSSPLVPAEGTNDE